MLLPAAAQAALTVALSASPASIAYGGTTQLSWMSTDTTVCSIPWGSSATSGSSVSPTLFNSTTFTITCYGPAGSQSSSVTVAVAGPPPPPTVSVTADPPLVPFNGVSVLTWASTHATSCNTPWGATATSGTYTTPPITYGRTFTVTCSGYGGSNAASVFVNFGAVAPVPPPTVTLSASPASIAWGASTTLTWGSTNASSCSTPWGATAIAGSHVTAALTSSTTFSISCTGSGGTRTASTTVNVATQPPAPTAPTVTLSANPQAIAYGASTTLNWSSTNATACSTPWGATATAGSHTTPPLTSSTSYVVSCTGAGGTRTASTTVTVGSAPAPTLPTVSLTANPASIAYNATSVLSWVSSNATACTTPWGSSATSGTISTPALTATTTYAITCAGPGGSQTAAVTVQVAAPPPPPPLPPPTPGGVTATLTANPTSVFYGASATLTWASTNATYCSIPWGSSATSGTYTTPSLFGNTGYTITCYGPGGSQSSSVTVVVSGPPPAPTVTLTADALVVPYNGVVRLTWASTNATSCNTPWGASATSGVYTTPPITYDRTYTVTCSGYGGSKAAFIKISVGTVQAPVPAVTLTANPASLAYGASTTLSWGSTHATSCTTPWGATATSGNYSVALTSTATFTVTCTGPGGTQSASATVTVAAQPPAPPPPPPPPLPPPPPVLPTVSLGANPAAVATGGTSTLTWSSTDATSCTTPWGATALAGSYTTPALTATTTYAVTCAGAAGSQTASATVTVTAPGGGSNPPIVFNATSSAQAGDVISLQGDNFGDAPFVYLDSAPGTALEIVNRVANSWLAVQIPASAQGALVLHIRNATGTSAAIKLNAARPLHLDAIQLVPGGAFRLFGRNLLLPGSTPSVQMDGLAAAVDLTKSNEHMLSVTVPATLAPTASTTLRVDNGNGSGAAQLDRAIQVVAAPLPGSGDPFGLGVGWAAGFASLATRSIDAATDVRLSPRVVCDGVRNDSPAIQQAIQLAASLGGAVVRLPAGRCRMAGGMNMQSNVVVQGAGKTATELVYEANYPVFGVGLDLVGIRNLTLTNSGTATEGPLLKQSTRVMVQNVRVQLGTSKQMYLDGNRNVVISGSDFVQTGSLSFQGPYILNDSAGLVFQGNTTQWIGGAPAFGRIHDSYVQGNRFTRDGNGQNSDGNGAVHSFTIDFAYRIAVVGNTFDVANGPITNKTRNDGETILTEGGGDSRTENLGSVSSAGSHTFTDTANTLNADPFGNGYTPENYGVAIVGGKGAGQTRRVVSYSGHTATVDRAWDVVPDTTSRYATFVWGLEKSLIKDNTLAQNPRGIWIYHTAVRDVDVIGNQISEGGGIYMRSYQNLSTKSFTPIYNVLVARNVIRNTTGHWMSYLNSVFVNSDARAFGIAFLGIEVRANQITANTPNVSSQLEEYAGVEGFMNMMRVENYGGYESSVVPRVLGTIYSGNRCTHCDVAVRIGTGAGGTTILGTQLFNTPVLYTDWATTVTPERAIGTVVR